MALIKTSLPNVYSTQRNVPFSVLSQVHTVQEKIAKELGHWEFALRISQQPIKLVNGRRSMWQLDIISHDYCLMAKHDEKPSTTPRRFRKFNGGHMGVSVSTALSRVVSNLSVTSKV